MNELLTLSIGIGLAVGMLFTEVFGIASGGLIVPGYMALFLTRPLDIALTLGVALATFGAVRVLSTFLIVYGRRRTASMILFGFVFGLLLRRVPGLDALDAGVIGFIIPGLIANWMDRQGLLQTVTSLTIVAVVVRLVLVLFIDSEALR